MNLHKAKYLIAALGKLEGEIFDKLTKIKESNIATVNSAAEEAHAIVSRATFIGFLVAILVGLFVVGLAFCIIRGIARQLS